MQPDSQKRVPLRNDTLAAYIEQKLDREAAVLDLLVGAETKGQGDPALWKLLHEAAQRDARQTELAAAYDKLAKDKKIKTLTPASQAEILTNAGVFFADVAGDAAKASELLERALAAAPGHAQAFERLEKILVERQELARLADLYATAAPSRGDKREQLALLRRAIDIATAAGDDERLIKLYQQILKSEPTDKEARRVLEEQLTKTGRFAEVAKMLEQALAGLTQAEDTPDDDVLALRSKLIRLYTTELKETERALGHVEEVLRVDPAREPAFEVAEQMLANKAVAARAASALADVYDRMGDANEAARMMAIEVDHLRGPKRVEAQKRLANLILQRIGDIHGALAHFEAIVTIDPADEEFRQRYRELSAVLDKKADAARVLTRALVASKEPALKARINAELGELLLELGDAKKARAAFQSVLDAGGDDGAILRATRAMVKLAEGARDPKGLAALLERLSDLEVAPDARAAAADRLAKLYEGELSDPKGAIGAYKKLYGTPLEGAALTELTRLFEASGDNQGLAGVLERRADLVASEDAEAARELAFRAAEIRSTKLSDRAAAADAWRHYIAAYGPSPEAHARLFPLLEQDKRWEELAQRLGREAEIVPEAMRAAVLARLGQLKGSRLADERGALEAYRDALAIDPAEKTSRGALEKALSAGSQQLFAASVLEPIARSEGAAELRVRLLEVRGLLSEAAAERLRALEEAASIAEAELGDGKRALSVAARALKLAVDESSASAGGAPEQPSPEPAKASEVKAWIERVERLGAGDAAGSADALSKALGDRDITSPMLADLARRAGDALAAAGEPAKALAILKRALAYAPSSQELLAKVDALLSSQGSPDERIALYRAALDRAEDAAARGKLLHAIGGIELRQKKDPAAAIETYRRAIASDPDDRAALSALIEAHAAAGPSKEFYDDVEQALPRLTGPELDAARVRLADVALACGFTERAVSQYRALFAEGVAVPVLALPAVERLAEEQGDLALLYAACERRVAAATEPHEEARWLERLGELAAQREDQGAAVAAWKKAAETAEQAAAFAEDDAEESAWAARLYARVLKSAPDDAEAIERLVELYRSQGAWEKLPLIHVARIRGAKDGGDATRRLLAFEEAAIRAPASDTFREAAERVVSRYEPLPAPLAEAIQASLARVLSADPDRKNQAAVAHRALLEKAEGDVKAYVAAFEAFLSGAGAERQDDRRWLYAYRLERAEEGDRIPILLAWAADEEKIMADPGAAAGLYGRVLEIEPEHEVALEARARLLLESGDAAGAVALLVARRDLAQGAARAALGRQLASLLIDRLGRFEEGLTAIEPVLRESPGDEAALRIVGRAMAEPDTRARAAGLLQRACDAVLEPEARAKILDMLLSTPPDAPELRSFRRGWFERLLAPLSDNPHRALEVALRAVAERPQEAALWDQVEQLGRETDRPDLVAEAYKKEIQRKHDAPLDLESVEELGRRAVEYHEQWRDDAAEIAALLSRIVELVPESSWAFERLKLAYNAAEQWGSLFELYDRAIERAGEDAIARGEILEEAVEAAKNLANDTERTMIYLEQLLPLRKDARTRAALERLYEKHGRFRPLIDLLAAQLPGLEQEAAQKMRARVAGLWLDGARDPEAALSATVAMLAIEPGRAEAIALLERLLSATQKAPGVGEAGEAEAAPLAARREAAALLEERYRAEGRPEDLVRVLEVLLEGRSDREERARRLREIVAIRRDAMGDRAGALSAVASLVEIEPAAQEHRAELERLAAELGRFDRLAEALAAASAEASREGFRALSLKLLARSAEIHRDHLGNLDKAIEQSRAILGLAEGDAEATLEALRELDRLLARAGRAAERCDVLERLAAAEPDRSARKAALGELARIAWSELSDADRAIAAYRARLEGDEADIEALDGLAAALEQTSRWAELTGALGQRAAAKIAKGDAGEAKADLVRAAAILDEKIGDPDAAIQAWAGVREKFGPDALSADALAALFSRQARWPELVELYEGELTAAPSGERQGELWRRLGDVHRDRTAAWDRAITSYSKGISAGDEGARGGLEELLSRVDQASIEQRPILVSAVDVLCAAYGAAGSVKPLIALLEPRLAAAESDVRRVAILEETAKLLEAGEGDTSRAFDAIWRALLLAPSEPLATEALRLARAADRLGDVADALGSGFAARDDVPKSALRDLFWHVGLWQRDARLDPASAEAAMARALEQGGESVEILSALADLRRREPGRPLVETLLRLADVTEPSPALLDLLEEAVATALDPVGDREVARSTAARLFDAAMELWSPATGDGAGAPLPEGGRRALRALDTLVRMAREEGDRASVLALSQKGAELPFGEAERKRLRIQAAEAAEPELAIAIYKGIFDEDPTNARASGELEVLYRKLDKKAELLALRRRQVEVAGDAASRVALRLDLARLLEDAGDLDAAIAALRENLAEDPAHVASVKKLSELLAAQGLHPELCALWEGEAARLEGAGEALIAAELWAKAAGLAEEELSDAARAIASHRRAASLGAPASERALARLLTSQGEHAAAAEVLEVICDRASPESAHAEILRLVDARVAAGQPEIARARLEQSIPSVKTPAPLRERLAVLYREAEAWAPLADLIVAEAGRTEGRSARLARLREAAELHLVRRKDPAAAIPLLEQAAELVPEDMAARLTLCQAYVAAGRLKDAAAILRGLIASYGGRRPKERALVHLELARVLIKAGDRAPALEELEAALRIDPAHPDILHALATLAFEMDQLDRASRAYRALLLIVRRARDRDDQSTGVARAEVLFALSEIAERQSEPDRAAEYFDSAYEASRESAEERERLVTALRARGRHGMLARALEARLATAADSAQAVGILKELAAVYEEHLGRPEDALDAWLRAVALDPSADEAHAAARALSAAVGQTPKYIAAASKLAEEATDEARKLDLLLHLGRAFGGDPASDAQAAPVYKRAEGLLSARPEHPGRVEVWRALDAIYGRAGDRGEQAAVLERLIEATSDAEGPAGARPLTAAEQADPLYRLAAIRLSDPAAQEQGAALLERALTLDPQPDRVEAALRDAVRVAPKSEHALRLLERFARETKRSGALAEAISMLAALGKASAAQLREASGIALAAGDRALAEACLRALLALPEADVEEADRARSLVDLGEIREAAGDTAEAADLLERASQIAPAGQARALSLHVASLVAGPLGDLPRAARLYEALAASEPGARAIWEPLADIYRRLGDEPSLAALIERTAPLVDSPLEQSMLRTERARIVMKSDPGRAIDLFREILAEDPTQSEASALLAELLEQAGRTDELIAILMRKLETAKDRGDAQTVLPLSMKLGSLLEQQGDEGGALGLYHGVVDWDGTNLPALRAIVRLGMKREDSVDLGDALDKLLKAKASDEAALLALHLGALRSGRGDALGAEQALEAGFAASPKHPGIRERLVESYTARASWQKLASLFLSDASSRESKAERVELLCRAAELLRERAHDVPGAAQALERALEVEPGDRDVLLALIDAYEAMGEHAKAARAISVAIASTPDDPWLHRSRSLHREALGLHDEALADIERAYEMTSGAYASELVLQLEKAVARATEEVPSISEWDPAPADESPQRALRLRLVEVLRRAGEADRARGHLSEILRLAPEDRDALRLLASLEEDAGHWEAAAGVFGRLLSVEKGDALIDVAARLADMYERAGRPGDARVGLERALASAPGSAVLRERLRAIYTAEGATRELARLLREDAAAAKDAAGRLALLLQAGRLFLSSNEDAEQAAEVLEEARAVKPDDQETALLLAEARAATGDIAAARAVIGQAIAAHKGRRTKQLAAVYHRLSRIESAQGNLSESLAALAKAFEMDPSSGAFAMELGLQAIDLCEYEIASRAFRSVTMMKAATAGGTEGISPASRAVAYYHLGDIAKSQGDLRKARLMVEKAVSEDSSLEPARALLEELRGG